MGQKKPFGNTCSPSIATACLCRNTEYDKTKTSPESPYYNEACLFIKRKFYVDDGLGCTYKAAEEIVTMRATIKLLEKFNIRVHETNSNSSSFKENFTEREQSSNSDIHTTSGVS